MHHRQRSVQLRLALRETRRIGALAHRFVKDFPDKEARPALENASPDPVPSVRGALSAWRIQHQRQLYSIVFRVRRYPLFSSASVPFLAVLRPAGDTAVTFPPRDRPDLSPIVACFTLECIFQAQNWRLPEELVRQEVCTAMVINSQTG
jgi:hypothetical protein